MPDFDMTPYGAFIWPAWAITGLVLTGVVLRTVSQARRWQRALKSLENPPS